MPPAPPASRERVPLADCRRDVLEVLVTAALATFYLGYAPFEARLPAGPTTPAPLILAAFPPLTRRRRGGGPGRAESLAAAELTLRRGLEVPPAAVWSADAGTLGFDFMTDVAEEMTGFPPARWYEPGFWIARVVVEDRAHAMAKRRSAVDAGLTHELDYRFVTADGRTIWLRDRAVVERDEWGRPGRLYGSLVDVTERLRRERELRSSELSHRAIVEHATLGIYRASVEGRVLTANAAFLSMLGYRPEDLEGLNLSEDVYVEPESRAQFLERLERASRVEGVTTRWRRRDGGEIDVRLTGRVVRDERGQPSAIEMIAEDVTERLRTAEALRRSEALHRELLEQAPFGIYHSGRDGQLIWVNPRMVEILGFDSAEEVLSLGSAKAFWAEPGQHDQLAIAVDPRGQFGPLDVRWKRKDGAILTVRLSGRDLRDVAGRAGTIESFAEDVTEARAMEAQLRQAQKMEVVGQLTGGIAHDFNNILTIVLSTAQLMAAEARAESQVAADVAEIVAATKRGAAMVRRLLQFSRSDLMTPTLLRPGAVVNDLAPMLRTLLTQSIQLEILDRTDERDVVRADSGALEQMLMNLCTNARDAMPEGGSLRIECSRTTLDEGYRAVHPWVRAGEYVVVAVTDTGCGMDESVRARLFEPFFTTKPPGQGTGLGMAMVYALMKQHSGMAHVYSEVGRGTTVRLYLPLSTTAARPGPTSRPSEPSVARGRETILVVDDEAGIRRATKRALEGGGYEVLLAADGEQALEIMLADGDRVALVISDLVMPDLGGRQLAEALRRRGSVAPILFTSGFASSDATPVEELAGGAAFLGKPWAVDQLLRKVRELLDA